MRSGAGSTGTRTATAAAIITVIGATLAALIQAELTGGSGGTGPGPEPEPDVVAQLTSPADDSPVASPVVTQGEVLRALDDDEAIWVVTQKPGDQHFHPQSQPCSLRAGGHEFTCADTYVGVDGQDSGQRFYLHVVVADAGAADAFRAYEATRDPGIWPGMSDLPEGAEITSTVTVTKQ